MKTLLKSICLPLEISGQNFDVLRYWENVCSMLHDDYHWVNIGNHALVGRDSVFSLLSFENYHTYLSTRYLVYPLIPFHSLTHNVIVLRGRTRMLYEFFFFCLYVCLFVFVSGTKTQAISSWVWKSNYFLCRILLLGWHDVVTNIDKLA